MRAPSLIRIADRIWCVLQTGHLVVPTPEIRLHSENKLSERTMLKSMIISLVTTKKRN